MTLIERLEAVAGRLEQLELTDRDRLEQRGTEERLLFRGYLPVLQPDGHVLVHEWTPYLAVSWHRPGDGCPTMTVDDYRRREAAGPIAWAG